MNIENTCLLLIGFQNEYFSPSGIFRDIIKESDKENNVLVNTVELIEQLKETRIPIVTTSIVFNEDYSELNDPVGILKTIMDTGAFKCGSYGGATIDELNKYGDRITEIPGKKGLNAFINTDLDRMLKERGVENIVLAGAVTSLCIDSTARAAQELDYKVYVLSDCTAGKSTLEQDFYCKQIFPLYAHVINHTELIRMLN